jgi:hypothetical protein
MNKYNQKYLVVFDGIKKLETSDYLRAAQIFMSWFLPAFLFVLWSASFFPQNEFYSDSIEEGKAPVFWNLIGSLGLFMFGICLLFPRCKFLATSANRVLLNAFATGCLTLGLIIGQLVFLPYNTLSLWQLGVFGSGSLLLTTIAVGLNFFLFYVAFLLSGKNNLLENMAVLPFHRRFIWSASVVTVVTYTFLNA